jgi:hypothetical protein
LGVVADGVGLPDGDAPAGPAAGAGAAGAAVPGGSGADADGDVAGLAGEEAAGELGLGLGLPDVGKQMTSRTQV